MGVDTKQTNDVKKSAPKEKETKPPTKVRHLSIGCLAIVSYLFFLKLLQSFLSFGFRGSKLEIADDT